MNDLNAALNTLIADLSDETIILSSTHGVRNMNYFFNSAEIRAHEINDEIDMIAYQRANVQTSPYDPVMTRSTAHYDACAEKCYFEYEDEALVEIGRKFNQQ